MLKKLWEKKNWAWIILVLFGIGNTIYFAIEYYSQGQLTFSQADGFILNSQWINNIILYGLIAWLFIDNRRLRSLLVKIYNQIVDSENNNVELHRDTQDLIIRMFKKNKGGADEEK